MAVDWLNRLWSCILSYSTKIEARITQNIETQGLLHLFPFGMLLFYIWHPAFNNRVIEAYSRPKIFWQLDDNGIINIQEGKKVFSNLLRDDFENSIHERTSIISFTEWAQVLKLSGKSRTDDILRDFDANEVAAAKKFKGPWLVSGSIQSIDDGISDATVYLGEKWQVFAFAAVLNDKADAMELKKGQTVRFYCKSIEEAASLVFGLKCLDYQKWAVSAFIDLRPDHFRTLSDVSYAKIQMAEKASLSLAKESPCISDLHSDACSTELQVKLKAEADILK